MAQEERKYVEFVNPKTGKAVGTSVRKTAARSISPSAPGNIISANTADLVFQKQC